MAHHGLVSVPGPANSDAYAIGGDLSDEEGGQANGYYLDPIKVHTFCYSESRGGHGIMTSVVQVVSRQSSEGNMEFAW